MPLILDGEPDINDQFVKALALSALNLLAVGQPGIKQYISAQPEPFDDEPPEP
jgi:hypothetical protein